MKYTEVKYFAYAIAGIMILCAGCKKDWFDVKSGKNQTVLSSLQDLEYLMDNYIVMNQSTPSLAEVGSDGLLMPESKWSLSLTAAFANEKNAYTWTNNFLYTVVSDWNDSYKRIFACNLVLDGLSKLNERDDAEKYNRVKGNALFLRAKDYYDLAQIYAQPYHATTASTDLGLPLKKGIDITELSVRSSVQQTYDQIISDLKMAAGLLPNLPEVVSRGSKASCYALLARTYLTVHNYEQAGYYANECLKLKNDLIDYNLLANSVTSIGRFNQETIFYAERNTRYLNSTGPTAIVEPTLYALYDVNDRRKYVCFRLTGSDAFFKGTYTNASSFFNGLATDEQYLIQAECYARAGNTTAAMISLNALLRKRFTTNMYNDQTAASADQALSKILLERKKELLFRNIRWTDLRRLNLDDRFKVTLTRTIGGQTYTLEPNSYKYTLPIPNDVMALAPNMKQNPGWVK